MGRTRKDSKLKKPRNIEIYKGIRKPVAPPGRPHEEKGYTKAKRKKHKNTDDSEM